MLREEDNHHPFGGGGQELPKGELYQLALVNGYACKVGGFLCAHTCSKAGKRQLCRTGEAKAVRARRRDDNGLIQR